MINYNFPFVMLHISLLMLIVSMFYILTMKEKTKLHYLFMSEFFLGSIWALGQILEIYYRGYMGKVNMIFIYLYFTGLIFLPVSLLFIGLVYANEHFNNKIVYSIPFVTQTITFLIMITNEYHHLFLIKYSSKNLLIEHGEYFKFHTIFSYIYIFVGLYYLLYFSIRNSGLFSKQVLLIFAGILIPFFTNILTTLNIVPMPVYSTCIAMSITSILLFVALIKFDFLKSIPLALESIYNAIQVPILILDKDLKLIERNKNFEKNLKYLIATGKLTDGALTEHILNTVKNGEYEETEMFFEPVKKHCLVGVLTFNHKRLRIIHQQGIIVIFKDITEIKELYKKIMQQDRLANLGVLTGGIAHDINSPASAIEGGLSFLKSALKQYYTEKDEKSKSELEADIEEIIDTSYSSCKKILQLVSSIRNQTRNLSVGEIKTFYINDLIKDVLNILSYKLKKSKCFCKYVEADCNSEVKGDYGKLSQVITNLLINAIEAYERQEGTIEVSLKNENNNAILSIKDYAGGIKRKNPDTIFKDIISTKKNGTGLGLYISHNIITGDFNGKIWFDSRPGDGTTFFISIPLI